MKKDKTTTFGREYFLEAFPVEYPLLPYELHPIPLFTDLPPKAISSQSVIIYYLISPQSNFNSSPFPNGRFLESH